MVGARGVGAHLHLRRWDVQSSRALISARWAPKGLEAGRPMARPSRRTKPPTMSGSGVLDESDVFPCLKDPP